MTETLDNARRGATNRQPGEPGSQLIIVGSETF